MIFPLFFLSIRFFFKRILRYSIECPNRQIFKIFQYIIGPNLNEGKVIVKFSNTLVLMWLYHGENVIVCVVAL